MVGADMVGQTDGSPGRIVTVGICPCWDITCRVDGISWGDHARIDSQQCVPGGKALNVSRALAWMGAPSIAAGLWGRGDYQSMVESLAEDCGLIDVRLTAAAGRARRNVTVVDTRNAREMHLRAPDELATVESLRSLYRDLEGLVDEETTCVFSGSLPEDELLDDVISMADRVRRRGARVVVDTSQKPLKRMVERGDIELIKPNLAELRQLAGSSVNDDADEIVSAARSIAGVGTVLVSRGDRGAIAVSGEEAFSGAACARRPALSTVGCGDWLLAGFLCARGGPLRRALERGLKAATAKAWGWHESMSWEDAAAAIDLRIDPVG